MNLQIQENNFKKEINYKDKEIEEIIKKHKESDEKF